ncbi:MAG: alpha/beta hydrolase family protein, partial [Planctomycetota bacterium]
MSPSAHPALASRALVVAVALATAGPLAPAAGEPVKGVRHRLGGSDRTYEMLVPPIPADQMKDMPLVVYLHPSGDPQLDKAKRDYWPILARRKCLLALPRSRSRRMWLAGEEKMAADVVADARTRYSVDAGRIVLIGVSGGGQVALLLADRLPETFRAIVAVSTSPVVARGRRSTWFYPDRRVLKTCPYLVVNHITQGSSL